jgi:DNA-binding CsgD family transcriptional regulator
LAALSEAMEFAAGMLTLRRGDGLIAHSCWSSLSQSLGELERLERPLAEREGRALAVEAWLSQRPVVIATLEEAPSFRGRDLALSLGLRSAVAVPAVSGGQTFATLEFYALDPLGPSETLGRTLAGIGHGLGDILALRRGELQPSSLTAREREILQLAAQGLPRKVIAHQLSLSPSTVKTHFENIYSKWGVSDRAAAVARGLREGLIE